VRTYAAGDRVLREVLATLRACAILNVNWALVSVARHGTHRRRCGCCKGSGTMTDERNATGSGQQGNSPPGGGSPGCSSCLPVQRPIDTTAASKVCADTTSQSECGPVSLPGRAEIMQTPSTTKRPPFADRAEAGRALAQHLLRYADRSDTVVLGIARGGVPVASEVARVLHAPLDVLVVRKLGVPGHEELAMGAIASHGFCLLNVPLADFLGLTERAIDAVVQRELRELERCERLYRRDRAPQRLRGRILILVDDGVATGASMRAAISTLRRNKPSRIVAAVPIAALPTSCELQSAADDVVCVMTPEPFHSVSSWYHDFSQTTDAEVQALLARACGRLWLPKPELT